MLEGQGTPREKSGGNDREARVGQKEKSLASVDECIVVSAGFAVGGRCFLALRRARLKVGRAGKPQRLISSTTYSMGYARTTGRKDGLGAGGWNRIAAKPHVR